MLTLRVQPRARRSGVDGLHGDRLRVRRLSPPVDDRANEALLGVLPAWSGALGGLPCPGGSATLDSLPRGSH